MKLQEVIFVSLVFFGFFVKQNAKCNVFLDAGSFCLLFLVVCLLNLTRVFFKHFMFVFFKFVIFGVLQLRHLIRLKLPDFLMVFTFCLLILFCFCFGICLASALFCLMLIFFFWWWFDFNILVLTFLLIFCSYSLLLRFSSILVE